MLTTLDDPNAASGGTVARGINNAGIVVGYYFRYDGVTFAYSYTGGTYRVTYFTGDNSRYYGVSNLGTATGYHPYLGGYEAFAEKSDASVELFRVQGQFSTQAFGVNDADDRGGQYTDSSGVTHGFFETGSKVFSTIDVPGAIATTIYGINNENDIVGTYTTSDNVLHGFLATPAPEPMGASLLAFGLVAAARRRRK